MIFGVMVGIVPDTVEGEDNVVVVGVAPGTAEAALVGVYTHA